MFSFTKNRYTFYSIAFSLLVLSLLAPFFLKLNLGIDMTGGMQIEYTATADTIDSTIQKIKSETLENVKKTLSADEQKIITDTLVYKISGTNSFVVEAGVSEEGKDETTIAQAKSKFVSELSSTLSRESNGTIEQTRYVNIGASFGAYIKKSGTITLIAAILAISLYIMYAFRGSIASMASWPFAVVTGVSLIHDVVIAFGLYVVTSFFFPEFKIDTFFITAMLTILGYSINDTIVVMDRIRTNLQEGASKKMKFSEVIDISIHGTLTRSLYTPLTILFVLGAMFILGPASLQGFTLALIYGTIVGTYSSICIASPLLIDITGKK